MSEVKITDGLIHKKRNIVEEKTIPYIRKALNNELYGVEPSGAFENFRIAAGESDRNFYGLVSQDSDVFKWMEAASLSLQYENEEMQTYLEEAIDLYRLDVDTRFTCKKELYDLLVKDNFEALGDYYFEMGYLVCNKTIEPKKTDGYIDYATKDDEQVLTDFMYNESHEISDVKDFSFEEANKEFKKRLDAGNYYVWSTCG